MGILGDIFKIGGSLIGGSKKKKASRRAEAALVNAGNQAIGTITAAQDAVVPLYQPYQEAGTQALGSLRDLLYGGPTTIAASPDYQFNQNEARRAVEASAAARGSLNSGATLKALQDRGSVLASREFDNRYRRLADLVNGGFNANQAVAQTRLNTAGQVAGTQMDIGNARAGGSIQRGNITAQNWQNVGNFLGDTAEGIASGGLSSVLRQLRPGGGMGSSYQPVTMNPRAMRLGSVFGD